MSTKVSTSNKLQNYSEAYYTHLLFAGILLCNWRFNMKYATYQLFICDLFIRNHTLRSVTVLADQNIVYSDKVKNGLKMSDVQPLF